MWEVRVPDERHKIGPGAYAFRTNAFPHLTTRTYFQSQAISIGRKQRGYSRGLPGVEVASRSPKLCGLVGRFYKTVRGDIRAGCSCEDTAVSGLTIYAAHVERGIIGLACSRRRSVLRDYLPRGEWPVFCTLDTSAAQVASR